ncbi:MAG: hypothetical protein IJP82_09605 [Bacteroidaceae bacterium]|nr:hypothetical protein [Bacteroidaceae bacterium]
MSESRVLFLFVGLLFQLFSFAQLRYPVVGTYKGKSAQGMAIWEDKAYLFNDGGHCRVLDLKRGEVLYEFELASAGKDMHSATASFGKEVIENGGKPVLYVAEFSGKSRCFVENLVNDSSILVQTIEATENGKNYLIQCWLVDSKQNCIYTVSGRQKADSLGNWPVIFRKYRLPRLQEGGYVRMTEKEVLGRFELDFPNCLQGASIRKHYMYIVTGFQQS